MGVFGMSTCRCNPGNSQAKAPNPDPSRWRLINREDFDNAHVITVEYYGCTNFDGIKLLVFAGNDKHEGSLDPHFSEDAGSPIARFRPDKQGIELAIELARRL